MRHARQTGFTMIELMIAIAVLAILLVIAVPSFENIIENNKRTTTVNALLTSLQLARTEAVKRGSTVSVCPTDTGTSCNGTSDWSTGWVVFRDPDDDGLGSPDCSTAGEDCVLRVVPEVEGGISVSGPSSQVTYVGSGLLASGSGATAPVTFQISIDDCDTSQSNRKLTVSLTGNPHVEKVACP